MNAAIRRLSVTAGALAMILSGSGPSSHASDATSSRTPLPGLPGNVELVKSRAGIEQFRLKSNGMDILLVPSDAAPVVTFLVVVRVGSRNEAPGNTGSAHLLEHMLFNKSTESFGRTAPGGRTIQEVLYEAGGDFSTSNMTTWCDRITMYDTLPADQLETTMKINADRLRRGKILDEERRPEMTVVRNEYERGENDPGEALFKSLIAAAVVAHPYHWSTIGWKSDIESVTTEQLRRHYDTFFWPDNSTAVLVGDFDRERALSLFDTYFGVFPKAPAPIPKVTTVEPPQEGERRVIVRRAGAVPQIALAWPRPGANDPVFPAFEVLASILADGVSARLYQSLVETRMATSVSANNWAFRDPFLLILGATLHEGGDPARVEAEMRKVLGSIRETGVSPEEVSRARALIEAQIAFQREGTYGTAWTLGEAIAASDWEWWVDYLDRIRAVTPQQVQAAAAKYLGDDQTTVGWFIPKTDAAPAGGAPAAAGSGSPGHGAGIAPIVVDTAKRVGLRSPGARGMGPSFGGPLFGSGGGSGDPSGKKSSHAQSGAPARAGGSSPAGSSAPAATTKSFASRTIRRVLPNGAVILLLPNDLSGTASVRMRIRAGDYLDASRPGIAEATAGMLSRGTTHRKKIEIARELESVGSVRSWGSDTYDVLGSGACLSRNLPALLNTMVEELTRPAFAVDELGKLKDEMKVQILEDEDSTTRRAFAQISRVVYPEGHPLRAYTATERTASLEALSVEDLRGFHAARYGGRSLVVAVCGKFSPAEIGKALDGLLRPLPAGTTVPITVERAPARATGRYPVPMKDKANVDILIGNAGGLRRTDPDYYAATLANAVLGQSGLSSRLGSQVRDKEGLTYTIVSRFFSPLLIDGPWAIYLSVAPANVERGIESTVGVLKRFAAEGITQKELDVEKSAAAGRFQVSLANNAGIAEALAQAESYGLGVSLLDEYPRLVRAVTLDEANRALKTHIKPDALVTVVAGSVEP